MPVLTQRTMTSTRTVAEYKCAFCDFQSGDRREPCALHEWTEHQKAKSSVHCEDAWGDEIIFRHFPSEDVFDSFAAAYCNVKPRWHGPGWYKEFTYRDTCRGCDMGDALGLEKVSDRDCADWIDGGMKQRATEVQVLFGLEMDCPVRFDRDGITWRRCSRVLPEQSISINFARPDNGDSPTTDALLEAWKVWRAEQ